MLPQDVFDVAPDILRHRVVLSYEALARLRVEDETLDPEAFLPALERHGRTTELDRRMRAGELALAIEIPPGFARTVAHGRPVEIGAWIDGDVEGAIALHHLSRAT